jgi:hypothetical protein
MRGKAMSGAPIMIGTIQLAKPPISAGITMKKIMIRPCAVVKALNMLLPASTAASPPTPYTISARPVKIWIPGSASSQRIITERNPPMMPAKIAKIR